MSKMDVWARVKEQVRQFHDDLAQQVVEVCEGETWKAVKGFPDYAVSDKGRVKRVTDTTRCPAGTILKPCRHPAGYLAIGLGGPRKSPNVRLIHRLVAEAFLGPCLKGYEVNHKDGNKQNNAVGNLEYCTGSENKRHAVAMGLYHSGSKNHSAKLTDEQVEEIRLLADSGKSQKFIASQFGVGQPHVSRIINSKQRRLKTR